MTDKEKQEEVIREILDDNEYRYHVLPHYGLINDWFEAYKLLAEAVSKYLSLQQKHYYCCDNGC